MPARSVALHETTRTRYLNYAVSVITARALPDVRDGLKPVQRRILYAMSQDLRLSSESRFRKCAAVVGEVMGKYHPHGDQAIYDAMVRLAQPWAMRYPLVAGQGNFGSLDGDNAAAMRYTEARLHAIAAPLLEELKKDTVDFRDNFEGTFEEPVVLPAQVPNLLVNGVQGIAVGMATCIPPHNLAEVIAALVHLVDEPKATTAELLVHMPAPDFPTGGRVIATPEVLEGIYETGSGTIEMRGDLTLEKGEGRKRLVITSIPYNVTKATLVESIAEHIVGEKVPQIVDVRDESTDDVRVVCELKRGADPEAAKAYLFKHTSLRSRFHVNLTCLIPSKGDASRLVPRRMGLRGILRAFLDFRFEFITRRIEFDLRKLNERIHILEGFERIFDALDEAIALIRESQDRADAHTRLRQRFELSEIQTDAVLEIRLYRLARMEVATIRDELEDKRKQAADLERLLTGKKRRWNLVRAELQEVATLHGDARRTRIEAESVVREYNEESYVLDEDARVIVTRDGWIKRQKSYTELGAIRVREGDTVGWALPARTRETVVLFSDRGRAYSTRVVELPQTTGHGEPIARRFDLADGERIVGVAVTDARALPVLPVPAVDGEDDTPPPPYVVAMSRGGACMRMAIEAFREPSNRKGRVFMRFGPKVPDDRVVRVEVSFGSEDEMVNLASVWGRALIFRTGEINVLRGAGRGVRAIRLQENDRVLGFTLSAKARDGLSVETSRGRTEIIRVTKYQPARRGGKGREVLKRDKFVTAGYEAVEIRPDAAEPVEDMTPVGDETVVEGGQVIDAASATEAPAPAPVPVEPEEPAISEAPAEPDGEADEVLDASLDEGADDESEDDGQMRLEL